MYNHKMEEIELEVNPKQRLVLPNSDELDYRIDEKWTDQHEELAREWLEDSKKASAGHRLAGFANKRKHAIFGLPAVIIPAVFSPIIVALKDDDSLPWVAMSSLIASSLVSGIDNFYNFAGKHERHMTWSAKFSDICTDIKYELSKARKFRIDPDEFLTRIQAKYDSVSGSAPDL